MPIRSMNGCKIVKKRGKMKKIYLDIGNSRIKMAEESAGRWQVDTFTVQNGALNLRSKVSREQDPVLWILSSVRKDMLELVRNEISGLNYVLLEKEWIPGGLLDYSTPHTLGLDRYLSCLGAVANAKSDVIVIDAGSAITIDYMSSDAEFKGGVIIPGKQVMLEAMIHSLPELPLPEGGLPDQFPGKSTMDCIRWGVHGSFQSSIIHFLDRYQQMTPKRATIYVTGGDSGYVESLLKGSREVIPDECLLFEGMREFIRRFRPEWS